MMGSEGDKLETYKPVLFGPFYYNFRTNSGGKTRENCLTLKPWQFIPNVEVMGLIKQDGQCDVTPHERQYRPVSAALPQSCSPPSRPSCEDDIWSLPCLQ